VFRYQVEILKHGSGNGLSVRLADLQQRSDTLHVIGRESQVGVQPTAKGGRRNAVAGIEASVG
jgi:hypothetical protein